MIEGSLHEVEEYFNQAERGICQNIVKWKPNIFVILWMLFQNILTVNKWTRNGRGLSNSKALACVHFPIEGCKSKIVKKHIWRGGASLSLVETWKENPVSWACMHHLFEVIYTFFCYNHSGEYSFVPWHIIYQLSSPFDVHVRKSDQQSRWGTIIIRIIVSTFPLLNWQQTSSNTHWWHNK